MKKLFIIGLLVVTSFLVMSCTNDTTNSAFTTQDTQTPTTEFTFTPNPETDERSGYLDVYVGINQDTFEVGISQYDISKHIYLISENDDYYININNVDFSQVDLSSPGEYTIYLDVYENSDSIGTYSIPIFIQDGQVPVFDHVINYHIDISDDIPDLLSGVVAIDDNLDRIDVEHYITNTEPGLYTVKYTATDLDGNVVHEYANVLVGDLYSPYLSYRTSILLYSPTPEEQDIIDEYEDLLKMIYTHDNSVWTVIRNYNHNILTESTYEYIVGRPIRDDELHIISRFKDIKIKDDVAIIERLYDRPLSQSERTNIDNYFNAREAWMTYYQMNSINRFYSSLFTHDYENQLGIKDVYMSMGYDYEDMNQAEQALNFAEELYFDILATEAAGRYMPQIALTESDLIEITNPDTLDLIADASDVTLTQHEQDMLIEKQTYYPKVLYGWKVDTSLIDYPTFKEGYDLVINYSTNLDHLEYYTLPYTNEQFFIILENFVRGDGYSTLTVTEKDLFNTMINSFDFDNYYEFDETITLEEKAAIKTLVLCLKDNDGADFFIKYAKLDLIESLLGRALTSLEGHVIDKLRSGDIKLWDNYQSSFFEEYNLNNQDEYQAYLEYNAIFESMYHNISYDHTINKISHGQTAIDAIMYFTLNNYIQNEDDVDELFKDLELSYSDFYDKYDYTWNLDYEGEDYLETLYHIDFLLFTDIKDSFNTYRGNYYKGLDYSNAMSIVSESLDVPFGMVSQNQFFGYTYPIPFVNLSPYTDAQVKAAYDVIYLEKAFVEIDFYLDEFVKAADSNIILYDESVQLMVAQYMIDNDYTLDELLNSNNYTSDFYVSRYLSMLSEYYLRTSTHGYLHNHLDDSSLYIDFENVLANRGIVIESYNDILVAIGDPDNSDILDDLTMLKDDVLEYRIKRYFFYKIGYFDVDQTYDYSHFLKFKDIPNIDYILNHYEDEILVNYFYNYHDLFTPEEIDTVKVYITKQLSEYYVADKLKVYIEQSDLLDIYMKVLNSDITVSDIFDGDITYKALPSTLTDYERFIFYITRDIDIDSYLLLNDLLIAEDYKTLADVLEIEMYTEAYDTDPFTAYSLHLDAVLTQADIDRVNDYLKYMYYPNEIADMFYLMYGVDNEPWSTADLLILNDLLTRVNKHPDNNAFTVYDLSVYSNSYIGLFNDIENLTLTQAELDIIDRFKIAAIVQPCYNDFAEYDYISFLVDDKTVYYENDLLYYELVKTLHPDLYGYAREYVGYMFDETEYNMLTQTQKDIVDLHNEYFSYLILGTWVAIGSNSSIGRLYTFDEINSFDVLLPHTYVLNIFDFIYASSLTAIEAEYSITFTQAERDAILLLFPYLV